MLFQNMWQAFNRIRRSEFFWPSIFPFGHTDGTSHSTSFSLSLSCSPSFWWSFNTLSVMTELLWLAGWILDAIFCRSNLQLLCWLVSIPFSANSSLNIDAVSWGRKERVKKKPWTLERKVYNIALPRHCSRATPRFHHHQPSTLHQRLSVIPPPPTFTTLPSTSSDSTTANLQNATADFLRFHH